MKKFIGLLFVLLSVGFSLEAVNDKEIVCGKKYLVMAGELYGKVIEVKKTGIDFFGFDLKDKNSFTLKKIIKYLLNPAFNYNNNRDKFLKNDAFIRFLKDILDESAYEGNREIQKLKLFFGHESFLDESEDLNPFVCVRKEFDKMMNGEKHDVRSCINDRHCGHFYYVEHDDKYYFVSEAWLKEEKSIFPFKSGDTCRVLYGELEGKTVTIKKTSLELCEIITIEDLCRKKMDLVKKYPGYLTFVLKSANQDLLSFAKQNGMDLGAEYFIKKECGGAFYYVEHEFLNHFISASCLQLI